MHIGIPKRKLVLRYVIFKYSRAFQYQKRVEFFGCWRNKKGQKSVKAPWTCRECGSQDYVLTP
jgi:hypothetical protein